MREEIWRDVLGYEGLYQVSNTSRIKSLRRRGTIKDLFLSPCLNGSGYEVISLHKEKKQKIAFVHRLIAAAFIPNPKNKPNINHINGIKSDNRLENLEWCTQKENLIHAHKTGLKSASGEKNSQSKITASQAIEIFISKEKGCSLKKKFKISEQAICDIKKGRTWSHITSVYL
jgi:hypothetical protein